MTDHQFETKRCLLTYPTSSCPLRQFCRCTEEPAIGRKLTSGTELVTFLTSRTTRFLPSVLFLARKTTTSSSTIKKPTIGVIFFQFGRDGLGEIKRELAKERSNNKGTVRTLGNVVSATQWRLLGNAGRLRFNLAHNHASADGYSPIIHDSFLVIPLP